MAKRITLIAALLMVASPAFAAVTINIVDEGSGVAAITYNNGTDAVRAYALDITVDGGAIITGVSNFFTGEGAGYGIFPGTFRDFINPATPNWSDPNYTPVAPAGDPGALGGIGTAGVTIELGSLYVDTAPGASGTLCKLTVDDSTCMTVAVNTTRGGVVLEDASAASVTLPGACVQINVGCTVPNIVNMTVAQADANIVAAGLVKGTVNYTWHATVPSGSVTAQNPAGGGTVACGSAVNYTVSRGVQPTNCITPLGASYTTQAGQFDAYVTNLWNPSGWCPGASSYQCHGDADGTRSASPNFFRVYTGDLALITGNWKKKASAYPAGADPRADTDHKASASPNFFRVYTLDLARVTANWKRKDSTAAGGLPANCPLTDAANNAYVKP